MRWLRSLSEAAKLAPWFVMGVLVTIGIFIMSYGDSKRVPLD